MGISLTTQERLELFGDWLPEDYEDEARERWGDTESWAQSQRRATAYTPEDWRRLRAELTTIEQGMVAALAAGEPADGERAVALAEQHRTHLSTWYYDCSLEVHRAFGGKRFTDYYERLAPGLAQFVRDTVVANADHPR